MEFSGLIIFCVISIVSTQPANDECGAEVKINSGMTSELNSFVAKDLSTDLHSWEECVQFCCQNINGEIQ